MNSNIFPEKDSLVQDMGAEIVVLQAPVRFGSQPIECVKKGAIHIRTGKILIYGTGKVQFPESLRQELEQLKAERAGLLGKEAQRAFNKDPKKQKRIQAIEEKELHTYQRSQGNLKSLLNAGMNPDSLEDAFRIIGHLIEEIEKMNVELEVGAKVNHISRIEAPNGQMIIDSK